MPHLQQPNGDNAAKHSRFTDPVDLALKWTELKKQKLLIAGQWLVSFVSAVFRVILDRIQGIRLPRRPVFYCLGPQLELVPRFFAESFNGEHLLPCFLVATAGSRDTCTMGGSEGGEIEGRN